LGFAKSTVKKIYRKTETKENPPVKPFDPSAALRAGFLSLRAGLEAKY